MTTPPFPPNFLWGAATAAHQVEGNNVNSDFWAIENRPESFLPERSGDALDSYHRWPEDLDLFAATGLSTYRFSLDWSRIEPVEGHVSLAALAHYRRMVEGCVERGLIPVVTVHHFTSPRWFAERGGWSKPDSAAVFGRFVTAVAPILVDVPWICTINEPNILAMMSAMLRQERRGGLVAGAMPPPDDAISRTLIEAHHLARDILHGATGGRVGWTIGNQNFQAVDGAEKLAADWEWSREDRFLDAAAGDDFVGVQAYTRVRIGPTGPVDPPPDARRTLTGWEFYPSAVGDAARHTADRIPGVPILVTENGVATDDDAVRVEYTSGALASLASAIADGVDVRGYLHWSWLDNYEWGSYSPTFGLVAVDRTTFVRTPKPSATWLGEVARSNGTLLVATSA